MFQVPSADTFADTGGVADGPGSCDRATIPLAIRSPCGLANNDNIACRAVEPRGHRCCISSVMCVRSTRDRAAARSRAPVTTDHDRSRPITTDHDRQRCIDVRRPAPDKSQAVDLCSDQIGRANGWANRRHGLSDLLPAREHVEPVPTLSRDPAPAISPVLARAIERVDGLTFSADRARDPVHVRAPAPVRAPGRRRRSRNRHRHVDYPGSFGGLARIT